MEYRDDIADAICERIADGESLRSICASEGMPTKANVFRWLQANTGFADRYARAREAQADSLVDDMLDIADDGSNDWMKRRGKDKEEHWELNGEHVQRSRMRLDARKWIAAKMRPGRYGDKLELGGSLSVTIGSQDADL